MSETHVAAAEDGLGMDRLPRSVAISGASGLIGTALQHSLRSKGVRVVCLVRSQRKAEGPQNVYWNPQEQEIDAVKLGDVDAIINLAGENVAGGRWTNDRKKRILESRVLGTRLLVNTALDFESPPKVFLNASAVGYYGSSGNEPVDETGALGAGFLAEVCEAWEAEARGIAQDGIRTVFARFGVVLDKRGGALKKMLPAFRAGVGGRLGSGDQPFCWISLRDAVRALELALGDDAVHGPVNIVSPNPITNEVWTKALGRALGRPTVLPVPAIAMRLALGELANEVLLGGQAVLPGRLQRRGFEWLDADLNAFLEREFASGQEAIDVV